MKQKTNYAILLLVPCLLCSCIKEIDLSEEHLSKDVLVYLYNFQDETQDATAEIIIKTTQDIEPEKLSTEIPVLKYNKEWLLLLTQDDSKHAAFSCTWAAINGKPLSGKYCYDIGQLNKGDLPPDAKSSGKTLGTTDGAGNEVRFAFTTTLAPDQNWMNAETKIQPAYTKDYYRFFTKSGLIWNNVREMLNYGCGIAFHNVNISNEKDEAAILKQLPIVQDSILKHLNARGCKMLAEPDGNKTYVNAAKQYAPIQTLTAQTEAVKLYPFQREDNLQGALIERWFNDSPSYFKSLIEKELQNSIQERKAICIGVHGTDSGWVNFLLWLNSTYGKEGDDSMWMPSQEEYYEYNYYRIYGKTPKVERIDSRTLKLTVNLPSEAYFYYPSVTVNLKGLTKAGIASVTVNEVVTGLSYGDYKGNLMFNIDCRKHLAEHATKFVERFEQDKSNKSNQADVHYFASMLKESAKKTELLNRVK